MSQTPVRTISQMTREECRQYFQQMIAENNYWLYRAILAIYDRQTESEKKYEDVTHRNGQGFTPADARILCSFAKQILKRNNNQRETLYDNSLSEKQQDWARRLMPKYARQLVRIAKAA